MSASTTSSTVPVALRLLVPTLLLALAACGSAETPDPRALPPLVRTEVAGTAAQASLTLTGTVVAQVQSDLGFRVAGKVVQRLVDAGQTVRRGQRLMLLDPADLQLALQAQQAAVSAARSRAEQTTADERRFAALVATGAVSASAHDQARAAADTARDQLKAAEAQAHVALNNVDYAVLVADSDGVVMATLAEPGQVVAAGQPVARLAQAGPREALIHVPEGPQSRLPGSARARLYGAPEADATPARLRLLSSAADSATRTFEARYVLSGPAAQAAIGSTITVDIPEARVEPRLRVPLAALLDNGRGPGVWIVKGEPATVSWRPVKVDRLDEESAQLSAGLHAGEHYVSLGAHVLHEGQQVRAAASVGPDARSAGSAKTSGGV
jgi:RND family efflux transporter MFP subunit